MKASALFSDADRQAVSEAITEAERHTSGEIVPVVATVSGRYDRAEDLFGVVVALVAVTIAWLVFQDVTVDGQWQSGPVPALGLLPTLVIILVGFVAGAAVATKVPVIRLPFISKTEMTEEVERRAAESFQRLRVRATSGGTGVLIYVSLYERMVRVLGDEVIMGKLDQAQWDEMRDLLLAGLAGGKPADGFVAAIKKCGDLLAEHFPAEAGGENQLRNELHVID